MQVTMTVPTWVYRESVRRTAEEAVLDQFSPDLTQKGFAWTETERAAIRSGGSVRMALLAQMGNQGVIDYLNGHDCHQEIERYDAMMKPNTGRAH